MKKQIIIFGNGKIAEVIAYYAEHECGYTISAFTCDKAFLNGNSFLGKPLVALDEIEKNYPPSQYDMFVAIGYHDLNGLREKKCRAAKVKGYKLISIVSPLANVPKNVKLGENCFIMSPAIIHPCVELGDDVFVWSGAMIGHHSKIGNHVWFTSCANIGGNVTIGNNCFFAMNATVSHSISVGNNCFIGANTLVGKNLGDDKVMIAESSKEIRLSSSQFLKISNFSGL